ncbi:MAG TPA: DUF4019 domain-containing protein [Candidatus Binataceae bacterium]|nr:DUF4019 domain-containing protein [Candidatus Binataceae bacterium]
MKHAISTIGLLGLFLLACPGSFADNQTAVGPAMRAAQSWLELVDEGHYRRSYKDSSSYFQSRIDEQKWLATVGPVRKPLGAVISGKLKNAQYTTNLPGAPDGQYVVIQFDTSFKNKKSAIETVTAMLDKDGKWRVSGYFIK